MKIEDKLKKLGFEYKIDDKAYVLKIRNEKDRFKHDFIFCEEENEMWIIAYKNSGLKTETESEILENHNNTNPEVKEKWLEIKKELVDYNYKMGKEEY